MEPCARHEMGQAEGFRPVSQDRRSKDQRTRLPPRAPDPRRAKGPAPDRDSIQSMRAHDGPPPGEVRRKVFEQRRSNAFEIRGARRDRDDGDLEPLVDRVQVYDVESPDGDTIQEDPPNPLLMAGMFDERDDPLRRIGPVNGHPGADDCLDVCRRREDHPHQRRRLLVSSESSVIDPNDPYVRLRERTL